jgi:hypothetical protein
VCGCFVLYMHRMCTIIWLMTFVLPSVYGVESCGLSELGVQHRPEARPKCTEEPSILSKMMDYGIPKCTHTRSKKSLSVASVVILFLQATIMAIFENLSTTTKTQSVAMLSRRKARHVIHGDGFPRSTRSR